MQERRPVAILCGWMWLVLLASVVPQREARAQTPARPSPAALPPSPADPFAEDARMQAKRTLRFQDTPLRDFLADLNIQTGIRFFADRTVAEDRLTLFARERPLAETLRVVAAFFRFEWRRDGTRGDYSYTLRQGDAARRQEAKERQIGTDRAADLIAQEAEMVARLENLTEERLKERAEEAARQALRETDPVRHRALILEHHVCQQLRGESEWRRLVNRFLRALSRPQIAALMRAGSTDYAWPSTIGCQDIPLAVVQDIRHAEKVGELSANIDLRSVDYILLRFTGEPGNRPGLRWQMTLGQRRLRTYHSSGFGNLLPSVPLPLDEEPPPPDAPPDWHSDPLLSLRVTVRLPTSDREAETPPVSSPLRRLTLGMALGALARECPIDMIADGFWSTTLAGFSAQEMPLGEALTTLSRMTAHRWWMQDGFVMVRSLNYAIDRWAEPPASAVERWAASAERGALEMDDCAEMAALPDQQFSTLLQMSLRGAFPEQIHTIQQSRNHLRLWHALTRAQRRSAQAEGVPYARMTPEQQRHFIQAASEQRSSRSPGRAWSSSILEKARFRLTMRENRQWGLRRDGNRSIIGVTTREEAVRQFQQGDPSVKPEEVQEVVTTSVTFLYEHEQGLLARGWFSVPTRWLETRQ